MAPSGSVLYLHCFRGICCFRLQDGRVVYPGDRGSRYVWKVGILSTSTQCRDI